MYIRKYRGNIPDRVVIHANDVNVGKYIIYVNELGVACYDANGMRPVSAEKLEDLFVKGLLISVAGEFHAPISMVREEDNTAVSFISYDPDLDELYYSRVVSSEEVFALPALVSLEIGHALLTPEFDPEVLAYTMTTEVPVETLTMDVYPNDAIVTVKLGDTVIDDISQGIEWANGENILTITVGEAPAAVTYTVTVTASPPAPMLSALTIGSLTLSPSFDSGVVAYTAGTTDASNILTFTTVPEDAPVVVKLGDEPITTYSEGIEWANGENILTITVGEAPAAVTYTVTVTASPPAPMLSALTIGSLTLSPSFDSGVVAYTAGTTDASNILTFTTVPEDAPVVVKLGDEPITTYSEGIEWANGENILTITVGEAPAAVTYTVTVTAS